MENQEKVHKRRVRYSGTHPRSYKEKYKEHNPEKYADTIEKVIRKGSTPAGMHISIMVQEILDFLQIKPGMTGLDATLGYGGHTKAMLQQLNGEGHIYALDVDPIESAKTKERLANQGFGEDILTVRLQNFADIDLVTRDTGKKFDFILADLGVSSMQIDNPERGFSYKVEGPLDLRLNPLKGVSAAERSTWMKTASLPACFDQKNVKNAARFKRIGPRFCGLWLKGFQTVVEHIAHGSLAGIIVFFFKHDLHGEGFREVFVVAGEEKLLDVSQFPLGEEFIQPVAFRDEVALEAGGDDTGLADGFLFQDQIGAEMKVGSRDVEIGDGQTKLACCNSIMGGGALWKVKLIVRNSENRVERDLFVSKGTVFV